MFSYEVFAQLVSENNVTPYFVGQKTGINPTVFTDWKNGKSRPKADKIFKLAEFFGVPFENFVERGAGTDGSAI